MLFRSVEIVIDRGIKNATEQNIWDEICQNIIMKMQNHEYRNAMTNGVKDIGQVLEAFYAGKTVDHANELGNAPIILR